MKETKVVLKKNGAIGILEINNPPVNALDAEVISQLSDKIDLIQNDAELRVFILKGAGNKAFVAGADIKAFPLLDDAKGYELSHKGQNIFKKLLTLDQPIIAVIHGFALGGGLELSLYCDVRVVAENAKFGLPETSLGLIPGYGGTQLLSRIIGDGAAKKMIYTGEIIGSQEAFRLGLADIVSTEENLMSEAINIAEKIIAKAPLAITSAKRALNRKILDTIDVDLNYEAKAFGQLCSSHDKNEGVNAFLNKRKPLFVGH